MAFIEDRVRSTGAAPSPLAPGADLPPDRGLSRRSAPRPGAPESSPSDPATAIAGPAPRVRGRKLLWHAIAYLILLLVLLGPAHTSVSFTNDEGAVGIQVQQLHQGHWVFESPLAPLGGNTRWQPLTNFDQGTNGIFAYAKHPALPWSLFQVGRVIGQNRAFILFGLAGALGAALAAWGLAGEYDDRLRAPAFWLVALSPVVVNAYILWAHAPSAAVAGLAMLGAVRIRRRGLHLWPAIALALGLAGVILLRSEGLIFAVALTVAVAYATLRTWGRRAALVAGAFAGAVTVLTFLGESAWVAGIIGDVTTGDLHDRTGLDHGSFLGERLHGAWISLLSPVNQISQGHGALLLVLILGSIAATVVAANRLGAHAAVAGHDLSARFLVTAATGIAIAYLAALALSPTVPMSGFVAAWPIGLVGVAALGRRLWKDHEVEVITCLIFGAGIGGSEYADGGGMQVGGRFWSPLIVPVAVLAAMGLMRVWDATPRPQRRVLAATLLAVLVLPATCGFIALRDNRVGTASTFDLVGQHSSAVNATDLARLPRYDWRSNLPWLLAQPGHLTALLHELHREDVPTVTVVSRTITKADLAGWTIRSRSQDPTTGILVEQLQRTT